MKRDRIRDLRRKEIKYNYKKVQDLDLKQPYSNDYVENVARSIGDANVKDHLQIPHLPSPVEIFGYFVTIELNNTKVFTTKAPLYQNEYIFSCITEKQIKAFMQFFREKWRGGLSSLLSPKT